MKCKKCGAELSEEIKKVHVKKKTHFVMDFKHIKKLYNNQNNGEYKNVVRKKLFIPVKVVISTITVILVVASAIIINMNHKYTQKIKQADALVTSGKYNEAVIVYEQALKIKSKSEAQIKIDKTLLLKKSVDDFTKGMNYFNTDNYESAFPYFQSVIKEDSENYTVALEKIKQCKKTVVDSAIKQAHESASKNYYKSAIQCISVALNIDKKNKQLIDLKAKYTNNNDDYEVKVEADNKKQAEADAKAEEEQAKAKAKTEGARIGMTKEEVLNSSWGRPESINRTITDSGVSEQWVYYNRYVYIENGVVTSIQD